MRKWTYLVASLLLAGATPMFTGCIDNDEPEGITILRGAKAELLKAQAAVEAARVAEVEANAALINAKAKVQEAKAANELAQAKINEAIAKQEEMKAQILETKDALKKAELERQLQVWENKQAEWEAEQAQNAVEAEQALKEWELKYKKMQAKYEQVLVELAKAKVTLSSRQQGVLKPYMKKVELAQSEYDKLYKAYIKAYRDLIDAQNTVADNEANKELMTRDLQWILSQRQAKLTGLKEAQKEAQDELAQAEQMKESELYQKKLDLEQQINNIKLELANLRVEVVEKVKEIEAAEYPTYNEMNDALNEQATEMRKIPAFKIDYTAGVFPWDVNGTSGELAETSYSLYDVQNSTGEYRTRLNWLSDQIDEWETWMRDADDNTWTQELISRYEAKKKDNDEKVTEMNTLLQEAINAYEAGNYPEYDPTAIEGYQVLDNAVIAFNEAIAQYNKVIDQMAINGEAVNAALETYEKKHAEAGAKAQATKDKATEEANKKRQEGPAKITAAEQVLAAAIVTEQETYDAYYVDNTNQAKIDAWKKAVEERENAEDELKAINDVYAPAAINAAEQKAHDDADKLCAKEQGEAQAEYEKVRDEMNEQNNLLNASINVGGDKYELVMSATSTAVNAFKAYRDRAEAGLTTGYVLVANEYDITNKTAPDADGKLVGGLTTAELTEMNRNGLEKVLKARSKALYGKAAQNADGTPSIVFNPISEETILNKVKNTIDPTTGEKVVGQAYFKEFNNYGLVGTSLRYQEQIAWGDAVIADNGEAVKALIADAQEAYDALKTEGETALETWQANREAADLLLEQIKDKIAEAQEPVALKEAELAPIEEVLSMVNSAIADNVNVATGGELTASLEYYIQNCKNVVAYCEKAVYTAETAVKKAQKNLDDWNNGAIDAVEYAERAFEDAQLDLENAQRNLTDARAALEAVIDQLSVDGLTTSEGE